MLFSFLKKQETVAQGALQRIGSVKFHSTDIDRDYLNILFPNENTFGSYAFYRPGQRVENSGDALVKFVFRPNNLYCFPFEGPAAEGQDGRPFLL